jgi:hypothetical protein
VTCAEELSADACELADAVAGAVLAPSFDAAGSGDADCALDCESAAELLPARADIDIFNSIVDSDALHPGFGKCY